MGAVKKGQARSLPKGIYLRGSIYWIRMTVDGQEVREPTQCTDLNGAIVYYLRRRAELIAGSSYLDLPGMVVPKRVTFEALADDYAREQEDAPGWRVKKYMLPLLRTLLAGKKVHLLTRTDFESVRRKIMADGTRKESSCNRYMALLSHVLHYGNDERKVPQHVLDALKKVGYFDESRFQRQVYLSVEQCKLLLEHCAELCGHLYPVLYIAIFTGLRRGDILKTRWSDVDFHDRVIRVAMRKTKKLLLVPLNDHLYNYLKELKKTAGSEYVIVYQGQPIGKCDKAFRTVRQAAGMPGLRLHDLRHTYATLLIKQGVSLYEVSKLLGHTSTRCTQRYAHIADDMLARAAARLDALF